MERTEVRVEGHFSPHIVHKQQTKTGNLSWRSGGRPSFNQSMIRSSWLENGQEKVVTQEINLVPCGPRQWSLPWSGRAFSRLQFLVAVSNPSSLIRGAPAKFRQPKLGAETPWRLGFRERRKPGGFRMGFVNPTECSNPIYWYLARHWRLQWAWTRIVADGETIPCRVS
jgi:hypothetical protein